MMKNLITRIFERIIAEQVTNIHMNDFELALSKLTTLDLEDDQVRIPTFDESTDPHIITVGTGSYATYLHIRRRDKFPSHGAFELFLLDNSDEVIGFIRGTAGTNYISFNLVYIDDDKRGWGIGTGIYKHFLDDGYTIKSDVEITDGTAGLYMKLAKSGYKPLIYDDGCVGLTK